MSQALFIIKQFIWSTCWPFEAFYKYKWNFTCITKYVVGLHYLRIKVVLYIDKS